jgi:hypothetical protein
MVEKKIEANIAPSIKEFCNNGERFRDLSMYLVIFDTC